MALDGHRSNLSPEAANYLDRVEKRLKALESSVSSAVSSISFLSQKTFATKKRVIPGVPFAQAAGVVSFGASLTNGSSANVSVVFPTGRFTATPIVTLSTNSSRLGQQADALSADGFRFLVGNFSGATAGPGSGDATLLGFWTATQMTEDSASG